MVENYKIKSYNESRADQESEKDFWSALFHKRLICVESCE